jgi:hypothetical protein
MPETTNEEPERKHRGCFDCKGLEQEVLTSTLVEDGGKLASLALCRGCRATRGVA